VNNFDFALLVRNGQIMSVEKVSARGREAPLLQTTNRMSFAVRSAGAERV
jgi:hypothetical protein